MSESALTPAIDVRTEERAARSHIGRRILKNPTGLAALVVIALVFAALISAPFPTLSVAALLYAAMIPFSIASYAKVRRQRAAGGAQPEPPAP